MKRVKSKNFVQLIVPVTVLALSFGVFAAGSFPAGAAYAGVGQRTDVINGKAVHSVYVNLGDTNLEVKAVSAKGKVGETQSLQEIAQSENALAAINGGYFNAYSDNQPLTVIRTNGTFEHNGSFGAVFGIDALNKTYFGRVYPTIEGAINGKWTWPNDWIAWGINHYYDNQDAIFILTPDVKKQAISGGKTIVVNNGTVTQITNGDADIPQNGFLIHFGDHTVTSADHFHVGDQVQYKVTYHDEQGAVLPWNQVLNVMGGGPLLVLNGQVVVDPQKEKFTDPKQTSPDIRMVHSFVGINSDNRLVLGTVNDVTIYELADVVQKLGLVNAVAMDSGASSGLYADGSYLTTPGRDVPNAIIVKKRSDQPKFDLNPGIQIRIDGQVQIFDQPPILVNDRTMVPLRKLFEALGCQIAWDGDSQTVTATKGDLTISLQIGENTAYRNQQPVSLDVAPQLINDRTVVPVRFISEVLGAKVNWDGNTQTVSITTK